MYLNLIKLFFNKPFVKLFRLNADNFDAMIIPGGFGAAKNLSNWATDGVNCTVNKEVENAIKMFEKSKKPMGLVYTYFV